MNKKFEDALPGRNPFMKENEPMVFISYNHADDTNSSKGITRLVNVLSNEIRLNNPKFKIFFDRISIGLGENWKRVIDESIECTTFLVPIVTPNFFESNCCREELQKFLEIEKSRKRDDLIFPIIYIEPPSSFDDRLKYELNQAIKHHQCYVWGTLRFESSKKKLSAKASILAEGICEALDRPSKIDIPIQKKNASKAIKGASEGNVITAAPQGDNPNRSPKILIIGEPIIDITTPICLPYNTRTVRRRIEPIVYQRLRCNDPKTGTPKSVEPKLGGVFYLARFLQYFSNVSAVYPLPKEDNLDLQNLVKINKESRDKDNMVPFSDSPIIMPGREAYKACRFIEVKDTKFKSPDWAQGHAFIRLDSGSTGNMTKDEADEVIRVVKSELRSKSRFDCIILADYDLGLFTKHFIENFKECIEYYKYTEVPVIVYSGRRMSKYKILKNCWIVADLSEVRDDIEEMGEDPSLHSFQFGAIVERYRDLRGLIVVGGKETAMASWECRNGTARIKENSEIVDEGTYRTPLGHRGLIASYLGLQLAKRGDIMSILPMALKISGYSGAILIDEFGLTDAIEIMLEEKKEAPKKDPTEYEMVLKPESKFEHNNESFES